MSEQLHGPLIAAFVALIIMWCTQFVAESYRRFRDGSALAAAIAGELNAYGDGFTVIEGALSKMIAAIESGQRDAIASRLRPIPMPEDIVFDSCVPRIGLLGPLAAESVIFVFINLRAFRMAFLLILEHHKTMDDGELVARLTACLAALRRANERGQLVTDALAERANRGFIRWFPG